MNDLVVKDARIVLTLYVIIDWQPTTRVAALRKPTLESFRICGWVQHVRRINDRMTFLVIRDHSGDTIQTVLTLGETRMNQRTGVLMDDTTNDHYSLLLPLESFVSVDGKLCDRPLKDQNPRDPMGKFEVRVDQLQLLNRAAHPLPFNPQHKATLPSEEIRMKYRYLDLRREQLQKNLRLRHSVTQSIRTHLNQAGFIEVETPLLFKSTPEGASEFLVPSNQPGLAYALPQSPQQFKQLLMAGGIERYFQIARCFRNEDLRADRQPEFTQVDLEMALVGQEDVIRLITDLLNKAILPIVQREADASWTRMSYDDAMGLYGSDKPDRRFAAKIKASRAGGLDSLEECLFVRMSNGEPNESDYGFTIPKDHPAWPQVNEAIEKTLKRPLRPGWRIGRTLEGIVLERPSQDHVGSTPLGDLRLEIANILRPYGDALMENRKALCFAWIDQFPLFQRVSPETDPTSKRSYEPLHHPFTAPIEAHRDLLTCSVPEPLKVIGQHYDLVLNGVEVGGGSIRIHSADLQEHVLSDIIDNPQEIEQFRHLIDALRSGCPPHGGIALGLDRLLAMLLEANSIRDVIAFPKNGSGMDLCVGAPSRL